jgi:hypothetical protein
MIAANAGKVGFVEMLMKESCNLTVANVLKKAILGQNM